MLSRPNTISSKERVHLSASPASVFPHRGQIPDAGIKNVAYTTWGIGKWDRLELPGNAVFFVYYTKAEQETNLVKKLEIKGKDIYFDNEKEVFK
jgi:hypothetical protein